MDGTGLGGILQWANFGNQQFPNLQPQTPQSSIFRGQLAGGAQSPMLNRWNGNQIFFPYLQQLLDVGVKPGANAVPHWSQNPSSYPFPGQG